MPRRSRKHTKFLQSAARARAGHRNIPEDSPEMEGSPEPVLTMPASPIIVDSKPEESAINEDAEVCTWMGGVNNHLEDDPEDWIDLSNDTAIDDKSDDELDELEGDALRQSLETQMALEAEVLENSAGLYQCLMRSISSKEWKKAEKNRGLGYNGQSSRSMRRKRKEARDKESRDGETQKSSVKTYWQ
jgi:ribosomal protein S13